VGTDVPSHRQVLDYQYGERPAQLMAA